MEEQFDEIQRLRQSGSQLTAEIESLRKNDEYRRQLMSDLSAELSLSASRETKLLTENQELKEHSHAEEIITIESLVSRDGSISFDIDDVLLDKELLEEAAVREALLQCDIAEAQQYGTPDAPKVHVHNAQGTPLLPGEQVDMTGLLQPPSDDLLTDNEKKGDNKSDHQEKGNDNGSSQFRPWQFWGSS